MGSRLDLVYLWSIVFLIIMSILVVQSSALVVQTKVIPAIFGEAIDVSASMEIISKGLTAAKRNLPPISNVEMRSPLYGFFWPTARTALVRGNWVYVALIKESGPNTVTSGSFRADFYMDGTLMGSVTFVQNIRESNEVEGIKAEFDAGADIPAGATLFEVKVIQL